MKVASFILAGLYLAFSASATVALKPAEIVIVANADVPASTEIAERYCRLRNTPQQNILALSLGPDLRYQIDRPAYNDRIARPLRQKLFSPEFHGQIRCLLTTWGVPITISAHDTAGGNAAEIAALEKQLAAASNDPNAERTAAVLRSRIDRLEGKETNASVDSELSMLLFDDYDLYRWQPNALKARPDWDGKTLMVSRLDGPTPDIAKALIDKALAAERTGLQGNAYIDSGYSQLKQGNPAFARYDRSLDDLALLAMFRTGLHVEHESTPALFQPGSCPNAALYCGWYSVRKYIDAFDFVPGAIGCHIASFEAQQLRDPQSACWCPAMLADGVTATFGPADEPYLDAFPLPNDFFLALFNGRSLVEAFYYTKPFNSWQFVLIGDPLYTPFPKR